MAQALEIAGLNGEYLPLAEATISPLDRGFLFGDAIYEVVPVMGGKIDMPFNLAAPFGASSMRPPFFGSATSSSPLFAAWGMGRFWDRQAMSPPYRHRRVHRPAALGPPLSRSPE